ncbi:response regulator transcription factor [Marinobacterium stanieri]|uniref:response regulator transcription factor n=1 Tax=Marinobacterium stanieri TaxID=49186 RepID=UPI0002559C50|nr:response regulator transcription factor [Marinobacterium stanieri]
MRLLIQAERGDLQQRWQDALSKADVEIAVVPCGTLPQQDDLVLVHWSALSGEQRKALLACAKTSRLILLVDHPLLDEGEALLAQGIYGYANTFIQVSLLPDVVSTVAHGDLWIWPELMQRLLKRLLQRPATPQPDITEWGLSQREQEVLAELGAGRSNKLIARKLDITERTVKAHVSSILEKVGVHDRVELILKLRGAQPPQ